MHYVKKSLWINLPVLCLCAAAYGQSPLSACLEQGKKEFAGKDYVRARSTFERCLKMDQMNVDALLSLGGVSMTLEDLPAARGYFLNALKHMQRSSPYLSYTYSMLGDIAFKQHQNKTALAYYERSLSFSESNVNSLVGKAIIIEAGGDPKSAAQIYQTALAVEPLNVVARKRLIALEPVYFTDDETLEALKQRYAAMPDQKTVSERDKDLFSKIHSAEQRGGAAYLKEKYSPLPSDYTVKLFKDTGFEREVLTLAGYNALQKQIGQDAIAVFQKAGVRLQDVFELRNMRGEKIFLPDSTLTDDGFFVYNEALQGRKAFLLPNESSRQEQDIASSRAQTLEKSGYTEISREELAWLKTNTNCSEDTLRQSLGLYILPINQTEKRYFVYNKSGASAQRGVSWYYVAKMRSRRDPSLRPKSNAYVQEYESLGYKVCSSASGELL